MRRRGPLIVVVLFLLAALLVSVLTAEEPVRPPLLSYSNQQDGARALQLWLRRLDYRVSTQRIADYLPPANASVVLLLAPTRRVEADAVDRLLDWVDDGNLLLVVANNSFTVVELADRLEIALARRSFVEGDLRAASPLLATPLAWRTARAAPDFALTTSRSDALPLLFFDDDEPIAMLLPQGDGHVVVTTAVDLFTNAGLQEPGRAALALNLIALTGAAERGTIWFDDWHHGVRAGNVLGISGPEQWLRQTAPGRAVLYALAVVLAMLVWRGRRFGRPRPLPGAQQRRAPLEYVTAIANLNRRAHNRQAVLADYKLRLKRQIGRRYHVSAQLPDDEFIAQLRRLDAALDSAALAALLQQLDKPRPSEGDLLALATAVDQYLNPRRTA